MFKTTIYDGSEDFRFKEEIPESGTVDGDISSFYFFL